MYGPMLATLLARATAALPSDRRHLSWRVPRPTDDLIARARYGWRPTAQLLLIAMMLVAPTLPAQDPVPGNWSTQANSYRGRNGERITFSFPAGGTLSPRVWGTDLYTDDSAIASAAVHAGIITTATGGLVTIEIRPGASSYRGSSRNGVTSRDYGAYYGSFAFVASPAPTALPVQPTQPAVAPLPAGTVQGTWAMQADAYRGRNGTRITITFPAGGILSPRLWGTDLYTDDSAIGTAAVHAGLITTAAGGVVTIEIRPGATSYRGSSRNGVTSRAYGPYSGSFAFVTDGPQPVQPPPPTKALSLTGGWVHSADRTTVTPTSQVILIQEGDQVTKITSYKPFPDRPEWATLLCKGQLVGSRLSLMCNWAPGGDPFSFGPPRGYGVPWPETYTVSADFHHLNGTGPQPQYYSRRP